MIKHCTHLTFKQTNKKRNTFLFNMDPIQHCKARIINKRHKNRDGRKEELALVIDNMSVHMKK